MDTIDAEKKAIAENKVTKPSDNVITPDQKPSPAVGSAIAAILLAIGLLFASLYFGILNV